MTYVFRVKRVNLEISRKLRKIQIMKINLTQFLFFSTTLGLSIGGRRSSSDRRLHEEINV
jgi:hypothetical protein